MSQQSNPASEADSALVQNPGGGALAFGGYSEEREKLFGAPFAHNTTLAKTGAVFSIVDASLTTMPASDMDVARGIPKGTKIEKVVYVCVSQETWAHEPKNEPDQVFEKDATFKLAFSSNEIRLRDLEKVQEILRQYGIIENVRLQTYPSKRAGFSDAHGIVSADQWKPV